METTSQFISYFSIKVQSAKLSTGLVLPLFKCKGAKETNKDNYFMYTVYINSYRKSYLTIALQFLSAYYGCQLHRVLMIFARLLFISLCSKY